MGGWADLFIRRSAMGAIMALDPPQSKPHIAIA